MWVETHCGGWWALRQEQGYYYSRLPSGSYYLIGPESQSGVLDARLIAGTKGERRLGGELGWGGQGSQSQYERTVFSISLWQLRRDEHDLALSQPSSQRVPSASGVVPLHTQRHTSRSLLSFSIPLTSLGC